MLLQQYKAQTFENKMEGGRNNPWLLTVKTEQGLDLYVTKFFAQQDINQQNALAREIYTSVLAGVLGLNTPDFALITIDDTFYGSLSEKLKKELERKHVKYAFGSKFISGEHTYSPSLLTKELASYDIESIFAFDILTLNVDRRNKKPNILLDNKGDDYYLIDHEHTFAIPEKRISPKQRVRSYRFKSHIFYNILNRKATYGNKPEFETFKELFRHLDVNAIDPYARALQDIGYETDDSLAIKQYLQELKRNISYFMNIVKGGIL